MQKDSYETLTKNLRGFDIIIAENWTNFPSILPNEGTRTDSNYRRHRDTEIKTVISLTVWDQVLKFFKINRTLQHTGQWKTEDQNIQAYIWN